MAIGDSLCLQFQLCRDTLWALRQIRGQGVLDTTEFYRLWHRRGEVRLRTLHWLYTTMQIRVQIPRIRSPSGDCRQHRLRQVTSPEDFHKFTAADKNGS